MSGATIELPATMEALDDLAEFILKHSAAAKVETFKASKLRLAVDEIFTNIVMHGLGDQTEGQSIIAAALQETNYLVITLQDQGPAYDPTEIKDPAHLDLPLEERPYGGYGVYLARTSVDSFDYRSENGTNTHTFKVRLKA